MSASNMSLSPSRSTAISGVLSTCKTMNFCMVLSILVIFRPKMNMIPGRSGKGQLSLEPDHSLDTTIHAFLSLQEDWDQYSTPMRHIKGALQLIMTQMCEI